MTAQQLFAYDSLTPRQLREAWRAQFRQAVAKSGMTHVSIARRLGVRPSTISEWLRGHCFPDIGQGPGLTDVLGFDLGRQLAACYERTCEVCGRVTYQLRAGNPKVYCSDTCKGTAHNRRARNSRLLEGVVAKRQLAKHQAGVLAMCQDCTDDGVCPNADCKLQVAGISPYQPRHGRALVVLS